MLGIKFPYTGTESQKLHPVWLRAYQRANSEQMLGWIKRGGGYELYEKLLKKLNLDIKGFFAFPMPTQPLGWFKKKPPRGKEELKASNTEQSA